MTLTRLAQERGVGYKLESRPRLRIENPTGNITVYRKHNKPALGPVGDSLEDFV